MGFSSGALIGYELHGRLGSLGFPRPVMEDYRRMYGRGVMRLLGVQWQSHGTMPADEGGHLVVANHRSAIDIALLLGLFGGHVVSRADVGQWPLLGRLARTAGTIFVDRSSRSSGVHAIRRMRRLLAGGETVIVFPEGTTHAGDEVREFHAGAFAAARGVGARVVPVGLAYEPGTEYVGVSFGSHLAAIAARPRTRVAAVLGAPLSAEGPSDELAEMSRRAVQDLVGTARVHVTDNMANGTAPGVPCAGGGGRA